MGRPNRSDERRARALPRIATAFAELGFRRTTTAELARRCDLREVALYRLWPDKTAMFVAAIEHVGANTERVWRELAAKLPKGQSPAAAILAHESSHLGEFGFHRILFAGLSETDEPAIRTALRATYARLLGLIGEYVAQHRGGRGGRKATADAERTAWALVGLGTATNLGRELGMLGDRARQDLFAAIGAHLLG